MNAQSWSSRYGQVLARAPRLAQVVFALDGRINRAWYWLYLGLAGPALVLLREAYLALSVIGENSNVPAVSLIAALGESVTVVLTLAILAAGAAMTVRRLHDRDKSGSWIAHFWAAPVLLFWLGQIYLDAHLERVHSLPFLLQFVALFVAVWSFVELCCRRGTDGPNRFGANRLQPKIDSSARDPHIALD